MPDDKRVEDMRTLSEAGGRPACRDVVWICDLVDTLRAEAKAVRGRSCACSFKDSKMVKECEYHRLARQKFARRVAKLAQRKAFRESDAIARKYECRKQKVCCKLQLWSVGEEIRALMKEGSNGSA